MERTRPPDEVDSAKARFVSLRDAFSEYLSDDLTEADTRSKLVDALLTQVLGWPERLIKREPHVIGPDGYIDYLLYTTHPYYVIEAKRKSVSFSIPPVRHRAQYKLGGVLSESKITLDALKQAREYAVTHGVTFCCVTNGIEFLFFRSQNDHGVKWTEHLVQVFRDHDQIQEEFSRFYHLLSYEAVSTGVIHSRLPVTERYGDAVRPFRQLDKSSWELSRTRERNRLFPILKDIISTSFRDLARPGVDRKLIEQCYVESPRDSSYEKGLDSLLRLRPVALGQPVNQIRVTKTDAGEFQEHLVSALGPATHSEVVLILGGVGVGKTTFLRRFRDVLATDLLDRSALWTYIDFNHYALVPGGLSAWVGEQIIEVLRESYPSIDVESFSFLKQVYHAEYERQKRGIHAPLLKKSPDDFEIEFGKTLESKQRESLQHAIRVLRFLGSSTGRRPVLVFDNADQFDSTVQDELFQLAQKLASEVECPSIISLREESYWKNKGHGALSAFHSTCYYIQPPRLQQVLARRFRYARSLLESGEQQMDFMDSNRKVVARADVVKVVERLSELFLGNDTRFIECLEHVSPGGIRRPLDQVARFFFSGHTNIDSLLQESDIGEKKTIGFHEFIESLVLGDREYFLESASEFFNMFAVDGRTDASNLNRLAVLGRIMRDSAHRPDVGKGFVPIADVVADCEGIGISPDTTRSILSLLNSKLLIETETKIKDSVGPSEFVRATAASEYYIEVLGREFSYIDLMLADTAIRNGSYYDRLARITADISKKKASTPGIRLARVLARLERGRVFVNYLVAEYKASTMSKHPEIVGPQVTEYFLRVHDRYVAESHQIEARAKALFLPKKQE